jgi:hypothetical protein
LTNKETKVSKTKQEVEEGQLLLKMFRRIADGVADLEIMKELNINDRKLYYYYKQNLIETSRIIESKKFQECMAFELHVLKDRMLRMYRMLDQKASDPKTPASIAIQCASHAVDVALDILWIQAGGINAVIGQDDFFDILKERRRGLVND